MIRGRQPFVSGLPDREQPAPPSAVHGRALQLLTQLRDRLAEDARLLESACVPRFDGAERLAPDAAAVKAKADYEVGVILLNDILRSPPLLHHFTAMLAKKVPA